MKKLFSIGVLTLVMLASCQNSNDEIVTPNAAKSGKTSIQPRNEAGKQEVFTPEELAIAMVQFEADPSANKIMPGMSDYATPVINCHTNYSANSGSACVSNGGYLFRVSWITSGSAGGDLIPIRHYFTQEVSSCNCN